ncbi:hypothetical protein [Streptoalloteichus hindustanus]|uniref:Uncharacterized protein n=1 Tax=Streptoalloteichus hindustanus TaxID=2017 RepID=A0A1M5F8X7_STRHI|nr:hypothetical protein [Streptoalloteichus hindustanus]SHF88033.1 hypothetical protein SAMN05444320_105327 [Streptoalloteichus hindustanus]
MNSAVAGHRRATAPPDAERGDPLFHPFDTTEEYAEAVEEFLAGTTGSVPVLVAGRDDLRDGLAAAPDLYAGPRRPDPLTTGVLLGAEELPPGLVALARPLATTWLAASDLDLAALRREAGELLVVGVYDQLRLDPVRELLLASYRCPTGGPSFLSGRDVPSLSWHLAKQYAAPSAAVSAVGVFTDTDRPPRTDEVLVFDDRDFERRDIQAEILDRSWRRVVFQGHGKDDSINLGEFTICGLNPGVPPSPDLLRPRCGYGLSCYKPEDKLVPLRNVRATEVVLSACNSGPLADLALYDPRYQLLLNALDSPARTVVSAVSVHDTDRPENVAWARGAVAGADSTDVLNASLAASHPYPAFLRFGVPEPNRPAAPQPAEHAPDPLVLGVGRRLTALLTGDLLPPQHKLRPRLGKLARKVDGWVARPTHTADQDPGEIRASLEADLQSLDHVIARQVADNPEDEIMNFPAHFGDRSRLAAEATEAVTCHCGRPAQRFLRRGLLPHVLDTTCVVCMRCGDVVFRIPDSPELWADAAEEAPHGGELVVRLRVRGSRRGPAQLGLFVPTYLRTACAVDPVTTRVRLSPDEEREVRFTLRFAEDTSPQAYYFTAYVVQDLAITTARRHFGVVPAQQPVRHP